MLIRRAKKRDAEVLWHIQTTAIRESGKSHYNPRQIEAWAGGLTPQDSHERATNAYLNHIENGCVYVVEDINTITVGFASLDMQNEAVGAVYVLPDYARHGIGRKLVEALEAEARDLRITTLHVKASLNAVEFYKNIGFRFEHEELHRFRTGIEIPCVIMSKDL